MSSVIECIEIVLVSAAAEPNQTKNDRIINKIKRDVGLAVCAGYHYADPKEGLSAALIGLTYGLAIALIGIPPERRQYVIDSIADESLKTSRVIEGIVVRKPDGG